jgi:hypothetical protein
VDVARELTARLAEPGRIPGAPPEFLGLIQLGERYSRHDVHLALARARRVLGEARPALPRHAALAGAVAVPAGLAEEALHDRDALERLPAARGLAAHAHRIAVPYPRGRAGARRLQRGHAEPSSS